MRRDTFAMMTRRALAVFAVACLGGCGGRAEFPKETWAPSSAGEGPSDESSPRPSEPTMAELAARTRLDPNQTPRDSGESNDTKGPPRAPLPNAPFGVPFGADPAGVADLCRSGGGIAADPEADDRAMLDQLQGGAPGRDTRSLVCSKAIADPGIQLEDEATVTLFCDGRACETFAQLKSTPDIYARALARLADKYGEASFSRGYRLRANGREDTTRDEVDPAAICDGLGQGTRHHWVWPAKDPRGGGVMLLDYRCADGKPTLVLFYRNLEGHQRRTREYEASRGAM